MTAPDSQSHYIKTRGDGHDGLTLFVENEAATARLAKLIADQLQPADVVLLDGALAAGKTFFVRALMDVLTTDDQVSSPTYAIANIYQTPRCDVLHVDAYRLSNAREFHNLGLETQIEESISLIEWGSQIRDAFDDCLQISIAFCDGADDARSFHLSFSGDRWSGVLPALKQAVADA